MAPIVMHAVIGERVYPQIGPLAQTRAYGSFLLGCMLADVNAFCDLDRRQTHFAGRPDEDGEDAFTKGSTAFLAELDTFLCRTWTGLSPNEQAFVAGYLCHLAADEAWKAAAWRTLWAMGITSADQFPIPVGPPERDALFKQAYALLHLNELPERFGLVMAEANGAGVPVIAYDRGSCREVIADGQTGFLVTNVDEAAQAVKKIDQIDPAACRRRVEECFSIPTMVAAYEKVYVEIFKLEDQKS